ncbi:exfoliative toxin [Streptococcus pyogenes]|uniref:TDT family transporter n=1 Tax=Streptococcus pyogenes TaxID=1314 RepID=UPI0010A11D92|nr:TDT family transporter [Streptococcus pyogenes]VGQ94452.1 exfoliative toxin [Streptococcus pyogenes]VGR21057.1 exfoliative toxin [Streptococcus pyogenes]VGR28229.1 exfoliative toxin [Streptococcus pyogenes]VGR87094.1 exfoliative toxin [Streptococcus pyogenes]VGR92253.1 exfoliative toxin [Streptococcus pyogenes]
MTPWKNPPLVMSGLALGTLSLGNLLATYFPLFGYLGLSASLFIYGILLAGIIRNPHETKMQLRQPLIASVFPTFFMTGMLLASLYLKATGGQWLGYLAWWLFFLGNFVLIVYYQYRFVFPFSWDNVFPSWSVLFVGIAMAALTSPASKQFLLGQVVFWVCLSLTGVILPFMAKKTYGIGLGQAVMPNISTFCAPLSLLSASYLATFPRPQVGMVIFLLISSQLLYAFVVVQLPRLLNRPFNPGFSAFTFPFVISATSLKMTLSFLGWQVLLLGEVLLATALVTYGYGAYLRFLFQNK